MYGHTDLKTGVLIELEGAPYQVTEYSHAAMGRGGAVVRTKLKNLLTGQVVEKTWRTADKIAPANIERKNAQFLYRDGDILHFMDETTYEQEALPVSIAGDQAKFLVEGSTLQLQSFKDKVIGVDMGNNVYLKVTETEPGLKGDTVSNTLKAATVETGVTVMVPLFINVDDVIKVDTRTGAYLERQK
jgi:elongation factor P